MTRPLAHVAALATVAFAVLLLASCGGGSAPKFPRVVQLGGCQICPSINNTLAVGDNRVSMTLADADGAHILDAQVHLRYYNLNDGKTRFRSEMDARFIPVQLAYVDELAGGERSITGDDGVYVSLVNFDQPGDWGVEIAVRRGDRTEKRIPFRFNVLERTPEVAVGDPAPPSVQPTTATDPIEEIDSSSPPRPQMHDITVADALKTGKPLVIAFATPAFCRSRTCAPVMDTVMDPLARDYAGRAIFIHIEPYVLRDLRTANIQNPVPATREWGIRSEPWVFVVGADGRVAGKFEGIMARDEVQSVLDLALANTGASATPTAP